MLRKKKQPTSRRRKPLRLWLKLKLRLSPRHRFNKRINTRKSKYRLNSCQRLMLMEAPPINSLLPMQRKTSQNQYLFILRSLPMVVKLRTLSKCPQTSRLLHKQPTPSNSHLLKFQRLRMVRVQFKSKWLVKMINSNEWPKGNQILII